MESSHQYRFRQVRFRDAPKPPISRRIVFSEQSQLFFEIFGDKGAVQLIKSMREFYFQARYITPKRERKNIRGMAALAIEEATAMRGKALPAATPRVRERTGY